METLFRLPDELLLNTLLRTFPCRGPQIEALGALLHPNAAPCRNVVVHGTESTGKSTVTEALLGKLSDTTGDLSAGGALKYAMVNSIECITARHLFERTVGKMLLYPERPNAFRFVLVFDAIDRQREASATLLPALARLSEIIPCLTVVFIVTSPPANFLRNSFAPHIHFSNYTKPDFVAILSLDPPRPLATTAEDETAELWSRFTSAVHDTLTRAAVRTLPSFRHACHALWPRFTAPILAGTHSPREFSKLLVAARVHFQDESLLNPSVVSVASQRFPAPANPALASTDSPRPTATPTKPPPPPPIRAKPPTFAAQDLAALLPTTARLLLLASYLASHNAARHDLTLFSTHYHGRRRRRRGGGGLAAGRGRHRKIARKLLGAHAFVLERMMAVFAAVRREWDPCGDAGSGADADVGMAIATLAGLRLLVRVGGAGGGGDPLDRGGKWRVNVGWEVVRGLGRSMGVEVEDWLID